MSFRRNNLAISGRLFDNIPKINNDQRNACEGEITLEEMGNYSKDLRNNKSPGIRGFTGEFYKKNLQRPKT